MSPKAMKAMKAMKAVAKKAVDKSGWQWSDLGGGKGGGKAQATKAAK